MRNPMLASSRAYTPPCGKRQGEPIKEAVPRAIHDLWPSLAQYAERAGDPNLSLPSPEQALMGVIAPRCGLFGCVFRTSQQGVMLKLTTDAAEAMFAATSKHLPPLRGLARHYGVMALRVPPDTATVLAECRGPKRQYLYAIWREALALSGSRAYESAAARTKDSAAETRLIQDALAAHYEAKTLIGNQLGDSPRTFQAVWEAVQELSPLVAADIPEGPEAMVKAVQWAFVDRGIHIPAGLARAPFIVSVTCLLEGQRLTKKFASARGVLREAGRALHYLALNGIILSDVVPPNNYGLRREGDDYLVILDAGLGLMLNPKYQNVWIDGAGAPRGLLRS